MMMVEPRPLRWRWPNEQAPNNPISAPKNANQNPTAAASIQEQLQLALDYLNAHERTQMSLAEMKTAIALIDNRLGVHIQLADVLDVFLNAKYDDNEHRLKSIPPPRVDSSNDGRMEEAKRDVLMLVNMRANTRILMHELEVVLRLVDHHYGTSTLIRDVLGLKWGSGYAKPDLHLSDEELVDSLVALDIRLPTTVDDLGEALSRVDLG